MREPKKYALMESSTKNSLYIFMFYISLFIVWCMGSCTDLKKEHAVLLSQKAYLRCNHSNAESDIELRNIYTLKSRDTLIQYFENFPASSYFFIKKDSLGLLIKEIENAEYKRYLYFDNRKECRFKFRGIPTQTEKDELMYLDTFRIRTKLLRLYDTLINNQKEGRIRYKIIGNETYELEEINSSFELIYRENYFNFWKPLPFVPDSLKKYGTFSFRRALVLTPSKTK